MAADMFDQLVQSRPRLGQGKWYTLPLSIAVHGVLLGALVVVPLMAADVVPSPRAIILYTAPPELPKPPAPPPPAQPAPPTATPVNPNAAPTMSADKVLEEVPLPTLGTPVAQGVPGGFGDVPVQPGFAAPVVSAPPPPKVVEPVRPGGVIREPLKIRHVNPIYPQIAQTAKISGMVIVEAVIGIDGSVTEAKVLRSIPMLDAAALEAVRQWKFRPTTLNGTPVPVVMTVTVNFILK